MPLLDRIVVSYQELRSAVVGNFAYETPRAGIFDVTDVPVHTICSTTLGVLNSEIGAVVHPVNGAMAASPVPVGGLSVGVGVGGFDGGGLTDADADAEIDGDGEG